MNWFKYTQAFFFHASIQVFLQKFNASSLYFFFKETIMFSMFLVLQATWGERRLPILSVFYSPPIFLYGRLYSENAPKGFIKDFFFRRRPL